MEKFFFKKIELWLVVLFVFAYTLVLGAWVYAVKEFHFFPYDVLVRINQFTEGHEQDKKSAFGRLRSEFGFDPLRFEASKKNNLIADTALNKVTVKNGHNLEYSVDYQNMEVFSRVEETRYFVIFGSFVFRNEKLNTGAILIDSDGALLRSWAIRPESYEFPGMHIGLAVTPDGDILTNTNGVLSSYSWCGGKNWDAPWSPAADGRRRSHDDVDGYDWHHDIVAVEDKAYTFIGASLVKVDTKSGQILSDIHAVDLMAWAGNSDLHIFDVRRSKLFSDEEVSRSNLVNLFLKDPFHFNKADILTTENAAHYESFEPGDILLSFRSLNLVVVARPSTKSIIWYRYGLTNAQHDATFNAGFIDVFDNNSSSAPLEPRIVRLDIEKNDKEVLFNLADWGISMQAKGNFELDGNQLLVTDDESGRVIYGKLDGEIDFVFENGFSLGASDETNLQLRNATEISPELVQQFDAQCAQQSVLDR